MTIKNQKILSIEVIAFPDGRLDTKNASLYLGLKEKTLAMMRGLAMIYAPRGVGKTHVALGIAQSS